MGIRIGSTFRWTSYGVLAVLSGASFVVSAARAEMVVAKVVETTNTGGVNGYYAGNREPLLASPLIKMPLGSIRPEGWLRHQLDLAADGMTGRLHEISKWCKFEGSAWASPDGRGEHGWEELPYWLKGFIDLGHILKDERIMAEAGRWVEAVLASQREDGYFGPQDNKDQLDFWPNMIMLYALRSHYEATGNERVLPFMTRYFRYLKSLGPTDLFKHDKKHGRTWWQGIRAADNLDSIYWLYNRTGDGWLLDLAKVNHARTAGWTDHIASWHGVNICQCFRGPGQYYQQTKDVRHLKAAERNYETVMGIYGQFPGGMFGADENAREGYTGPRQAAETCSIVEFMHSHEILLDITGQVVWADRCEEIAFNSLPAAMPPDLKALHYLTAPNMVQLDRTSKAPLLQNKGDMLSYSPYRYRCCQHNVAFGWPYFAGHLWMATPGNGLAAAIYAASTVKARVGDGTEVRIKETTDYPFSEQIDFALSMAKPVEFPLALRIPGWCDEATIGVNGKEILLLIRPGQWVVLERTWKDGDKVILQLPMSIKARTWAKNGNSLSVDRGPLTYSLKIGERWERYSKPDKWACYEVFPTTAWNYALIVDPENPKKSIRVSDQASRLEPQPFTLEAAPIALEAKGRKIPEWKLEPNGLIGAVPQSPLSSTEPVEELTLIPMGCARLRVSAFPYIPVETGK